MSDRRVWMFQFDNLRGPSSMARNSSELITLKCPQLHLRIAALVLPFFVMPQMMAGCSVEEIEAETTSAVEPPLPSGISPHTLSALKGYADAMIQADPLNPRIYQNLDTYLNNLVGHQAISEAEAHAIR